MAWPLCQGSGGHVLQLCSPSGNPGPWGRVSESGTCKLGAVVTSQRPSTLWDRAPGLALRHREGASMDHSRHLASPSLSPGCRLPHSQVGLRSETSGPGRREELAQECSSCSWASVPEPGDIVSPGPGSTGGPGTLMLTRPLSSSLLGWLLPVCPCPHSTPAQAVPLGLSQGFQPSHGGGGGREKPEGGDGAKGMAFKPLPPPQRVTPTVTLSMASSWTLALPTHPCSSISGRQTRRTTPASWASIAPVMCAVSARHPLARVQTPWPSAAVGTFILEGEPRQ